ncbi:MAG: hypothetical protein M1355_01325 [Patescibacteria group bacterium]|nr:hypothetical protein [Patescibacteria group bacterium]
MDREKVKEHIENHVEYPATAADIKQACNGMSDVPDEDKNWVMNNLPEGTYNSADEVKKALGMEGGEAEGGGEEEGGEEE